MRCFDIPWRRLQKTESVAWLGRLLESACADVDPLLTTPRFGSQLMHTVLLLRHEVCPRK